MGPSVPSVVTMKRSTPQANPHICMYMCFYISRHLQPLKPLCRHIRQEFEEGELEFGDEEFGFRVWDAQSKRQEV